MRFSAVYPKPSQTELLHWVTCLLIVQPEHECTYLSPSPCSKTKALQTHDGPLSSLFTTVSNTILPPSTLQYPRHLLLARASMPCSRKPTKRETNVTFKWIQPLCLKSVFTHHQAGWQGLSSSRGCAYVCGSPLLALVELSFKSVFIIRIVTMEDFFFFWAF